MTNTQKTKIIYEIIGIDSDNQCDECKALIGKYETKPEKIPPFHPNCKCKLIQKEIPIQDFIVDENIKFNLNLPNKISDDELIKSVLPHIIKNEGISKHLYLDTKGNATIEGGINVQNQKEEFLKMNLINKTTKQKATIEEKEIEFDKIQSLKDTKFKKGPDKEKPYNYLASSYKPYTNLELSDEEIISQPKQFLKENLPKIKDTLSDKEINFDNLPLNVKQVLIDMHYNMGPYFSLKKEWDSFFTAIKDNNFGIAAQNLDVKEISNERNKWRKQYLLKAIH